MSNDLKTTALTHVHEALGAKMVPFAGYNMPVQYNGLKLEHAAVREAVGMFDVSHMGEFFVDGPQALDFLQLVTSNDISRLLPGKIQYSCMPNDQGGIVDDLLVYCFSAQHFMLVVNRILHGEIPVFEFLSQKEGCTMSLSYQMYFRCHG